MPYKLVHADVDLGHYNVAPEGFHEVDEKYVVQRTMLGSYWPDYVESRQMHRYADGTPIGRMIGAYLYHFHDGTGVAIEYDYWGYKNEWVGEGKDKQYVKTPVPHVRYYAWGCEHNYVDYEVPAGHRSGIHKAKCSKCGRLTEYDTSD